MKPRQSLSVVLEAWEQWQVGQGLSHRTITERAIVIRHLVEFTRAKPLAIKADHILEFMARGDVSVTSLATYHASIRAYCQWLMRKGWRRDDPSLDTPVPKRRRSTPRPIPDGNLALLLGSVSRRRTHAMVILAACAGLRVHEIAKFHDDDLDRLNGVITVTGKGGLTQMIPAHERILELAEQMPRGDYWFKAYELHGGSQPHVSRSAVGQAIGDAMRRAGITGTPHQLRHWYGTSLLAEGVDLRIVRELMRHATVATTELYTAVTWAQLRAGMDKLRLPAAA